MRGPSCAASELLEPFEPGPHKVTSSGENEWRGRSAGQGMIADRPGRTDSPEYFPPLIPISLPPGGGSADEGGTVELSSSLRADLLDLDAWAEILTTYGRTMKIAVALTDVDGHVLGKCHNAQPLWTLVPVSYTHLFGPHDKLASLLSPAANGGIGHAKEDAKPPIERLGLAHRPLS